MNINNNDYNNQEGYVPKAICSHMVYFLQYKIREREREKNQHLFMAAAQNPGAIHMLTEQGVRRYSPKTDERVFHKIQY